MGKKNDSNPETVSAADFTPEELARAMALLKKDSDRKDALKQKRENMTEEQKEAQREKNRQRRANMTPEQLEAQRQKYRFRAKKTQLLAAKAADAGITVTDDEVYAALGE